LKRSFIYHSKQATLHTSSPIRSAKMHAQGILAASALLTAVAAVPLVHQHHPKRDMVWVTATQVDVVTVPLTTTIWVDPTPTQQSQWVPTSSATSYVVPTSEARSTAAPSSYSAPSSSSSSTWVAPTTSSTSSWVAPTSTYATSSTWSSTSSAPAATSSSSGGSGLSYGMAKSGTCYTGDLTWYQVGLGACGWNNVPSDHIVAISESIFDSYASSEGEGGSNSNPVCGKYVTITGVNGSPYQAKVVDRCTGCNSSSLDLSEDFFNTVTNNGDGRVHNMKWSWD
jgi:hypothetical protein